MAGFYRPSSIAAIIAGLMSGTGAVAGAAQVPPTRPLTSVAAAPNRAAPASKGAAAPARRRTTRPAAATPFDANLETILSSPQRRLAMIDGRIVQIGDLVRDATIVDITPTAVYLRDAEGHPRVLTLDLPR